MRSREAQTAGNNGWTAETLRKYIHDLDRAYEDLNAAIVDIMAHRPPADATGARYINNWFPLFGEWKQWVSDTAEDWILTFNDKAKADDYGARLQQARADFKGALGQPPPQSELPKEIPPAQVQDEPMQQTLGSLAGILKWGVVGYLAIQVVGLVGDRKK